jgi:cytoskeletal protein CcmA (bactofilin family)
VLTRKTAAEEFNGFLAHGTSLEGDLHFSGTLHLNGNVRGSITTADVLIIGEHATVEADIKAGDLQIYGTVIGDIDCSRRVEICESGRLQGAVRTPSLVIKEGGVFEGTSRTSAPPETPREEWESGEKSPELQQLSTS